jgi:hypothetical protein
MPLVHTEEIARSLRGMTLNKRKRSDTITAVNRATSSL